MLKTSLYSGYLKLDINSELKTVQDVIDNMLTRLEELTSVLQIIKTKNQDCSSIISKDICRYRAEICILSKKIETLTILMSTIQNNVDVLEKRVVQAELDFNINNDSKLFTLLKPFLKKNKELITPDNSVASKREAGVKYYFTHSE